MAKSTKSTKSGYRSSDAGESDNFLLVAAMDFGTTYSGYAYSFRNDPKKVIANSSWIAGSRSLMSLKTPTCVLLNEEKEFDSFGYMAENKYTQLTESNSHQGWYYFKHFKMLLHNNEGLKRETVIEDITGKSMPALTIFTMSIEYLKNHLMDSIQQKVPDINQDDVKFVITVPAIWDDTAKRFMREAAMKAGIDGDKLKIALEPEAASVWCQDLPIGKLHDSSGSQASISKAGTKYMVVDLGGGTADITVHERNINGTLKELHAPSGGPWGGTAVDKSFLNLLSDILGKDVMKRFPREETEDMVDLMREWETKKRTILPTSEGQMTFKVPMSLKEMFEESGKSLKSAVSASKYGQSLKWVGDKMRVDAYIAKQLFDEPVNQIINHLRTLFRQPELQSISILILVGGFSECKIVQQNVHDAFAEKTIIVPDECGLVILKGATLFGHKPESISTRIARLTYGISSTEDFDPDRHRDDYKRSYDGDIKCTNIFRVYVQKGDTLCTGESISKSGCPVRDSQSSIYYQLYTSTQPMPMYVTDEGCCLLGTFRVPLPEGKTKEEKAVERTMMFGDTELLFKVKHKTTGEEFYTYFDLP